MSFLTSRSRSKIDPNAPKVSKLYYLGLLGTIVSLTIFLLIIPTEFIKICGIIHISILIIIIMIFTITHTKKDRQYQQEKKIKRSIERANFRKEGISKNEEFIEN